MEVTEERIRNSRKTQDILHLLEENGIDEVHIKCQKCGRHGSSIFRGYFDADPPYIGICEDQIETDTELENVLCHELTHYLDYERGNKLDNGSDVLRSEIHASYYGDCYEDKDRVSWKRKGCILNTALHNTEVSL
ncbi:hypothetical protein WA171_006013 [Blastocystis sp. BT1]